MMDILIIGAGVLGSATVAALGGAYGHSMFYHDPPKGIHFTGAVSMPPVALLCVPTPCNDNGGLDTDYIRDAAEYLTTLGFTGKVGIRSTVVPGTCYAMRRLYRQFEWFSWPEFLVERNAVDDAIFPRYIVLGASDLEDGGVELASLMPLRGEPAPLFLNVSPIEAEFIKYATNCILAASVGVANELAELAGMMEIDWNELLPQIAQADRNMPRNIVISDQGGFGGKCLPKDLSALLHFAHRAGYGMRVLTSVLEENDRRRPETRQVKP